MSRFFDFSDSDREKLERKIKETWVDFRTDLTNKRFGYQEIDRAKECNRKAVSKTFGTRWSEISI